ncbi:MAG: MFS transporter [Acidobacteria bacterium]|nr:MFS transporter [Acidobacteriota bacterium]
MNRWLLLGIFLLSSTINYLDRQVLAGVAPMVREEFRLTMTEYGALSTAFAIAYGAGAPLAGLLIDRLGLTRGISLVIALWSGAGILTGLGSGLPALVAARALLGAAQAGGIPAAGKAIGILLQPRERALGASFNQGFVSLGMILAPPLGAFIALRWSWRMAFIATGAAGLLWIPLWRWFAPKDEPAPADARLAGARDLLADRRLWVMVAANAFNMVLFSFWSNWPVLYLKDAAGATVQRAAWLAGLPPLFSTLGAVTGGWLALRLIGDGADVIPGRLRVCLAGALGALSTAAIPWMPSPEWAAAGMSLSFFAVMMGTVNIYSLPIDVFGAQNAAFGVAMLTAAYGAMQALSSPLIGKVIDLYGYTPVCIGASLTPLTAYAILKWMGPRA